MIHSYGPCMNKVCSLSMGDKYLCLHLQRRDLAAPLALVIKTQQQTLKCVPSGAFPCTYSDLKLQ